MKRRGYAKQNKRNGLWGFDLYLTDPVTGLKTRRIRVYDWESRNDAEAAAMTIMQAERNARYGGAKPVAIPALQRLLDRRLEAITNRAEHTRAQRVFRTWLEVLPAGIRITDVYMPHLQLFVDRRKAEGQAPASIDRELNIIAAALHAVAEYFPEISQWQAPKIPRPKVSKSRRERVITDDEYRRLLSWLERPPTDEEAGRRQNQRNAYQARLRVAGILKFAMNTGMRPKEIYTLQWADIDFDGGRIRVRGTKTELKTNGVRYVPLSATTREILDGQRIHAGEREYIWTKGGNITPKIYAILRAAAEACGIGYGKGTLDGLVLYCARHTFATRMLQAGSDIRTVGYILGHSDREMTMHYSHVTPGSWNAANAAIDEIEHRRREGAGPGALTLPAIS